MGHGESSLISWHVDIQVDMCMLHLDVGLIMRPLHVHLGGE